VFYAHDDAYSTSESQIVQQALIARNPKPVAVIRTSVSDTDYSEPDHRNPQHPAAVATNLRHAGAATLR